MNDLDKYIDKNHIDNLRDTYKDNPLVIHALESVAVSADITNIKLLDDIQLRFLRLYDDGESYVNICALLNIPKYTALLWSKNNRLFQECLRLIKEAQAEQAESNLWNKVNTDSQATIERMFALKARKPEYRDNAVMPTSNIISVRVSVDGKEFDTSASVKDITE